MSSDQPVSQAPAPKPPPSRRKRVLRLLAVLLLLLIGIPFGVYGYFKLLGIYRLNQAIAEAERLDPGWRLEELEARREPVPDEENSALVVLAAAKLMPKPWPKQELPEVAPANAHEVSPTPMPLDTRVALVPPEVRLDDSLAAELRDELDRTVPALLEAYKLKHLARGRQPAAPLADMFRPHDDASLPLTKLLTLRAVLYAHDGMPDDALDMARCLVHIARSVDDEPSLISQMVRCSCRWSAVSAVQRTLAQGEPSLAELARLQLLFEEESKHATLLVALRGARCEAHDNWGQIEAGKKSVRSLCVSPRPRPPSRWFGFFLDMFGTSKPSSSDGSLADLLPELGHAWQLKCATAAVEIAKQPLDQQFPRFQELDDRSARECPFPELVSADVVLTVQYFYREKGKLDCAVVALAAERLRLVEGRWPRSLDDLVSSKFLAAIPIDPFDSGPLLMRRLADGLVIYSVGRDQIDEGGNVASPHEGGTDIGFRLFDVAQRRQPPRPAVDK